MKIKPLLCALLLAVSTSCFAETITPEVRKITPPKIEKSHLGKKILCHRPMRAGTPRMEIEVVENKVVAHDYGHGGSGWTLGPGSASYVNDLLLTSSESSSLKQDTPITIIGAGALGLFTAYDLYNKGYKNLTIVAEKFDDLTSHDAGGLLAPVSMDNDPNLQKIVDKIGIEAYKFYELIAKGKHKDFKEGVVIVPTYFKNRKDSGLEPYVGVVMQPAKDVVLDFSNGTTRAMVSYDDGIFIDTAKMMEILNKYLKSKGIKFVQKRIESFNDIEDKFIVDCSGMEATRLDSDNKMISVQGHLIMLKDQNPKDLQHMILVYFGEGKTKSGQKIKRSFYMFPKKLSNTALNDVGVIGGTFIEGATHQTPNDEEFDIMLKGAKDFYGIK